jgi:hypothetical protein
VRHAFVGVLVDNLTGYQKNAGRFVSAENSAPFLSGSDVFLGHLCRACTRDRPFVLLVLHMLLPMSAVFSCNAYIAACSFSALFKTVALCLTLHFVFVLPLCHAEVQLHVGEGVISVFGLLRLAVSLVDDSMTRMGDFVTAASRTARSGYLEKGIRA